jgi:hypothetical protein
MSIRKSKYMSRHNINTFWRVRFDNLRKGPFTEVSFFATKRNVSFIVRWRTQTLYKISQNLINHSRWSAMKVRSTSLSWEDFPRTNTPPPGVFGVRGTRGPNITPDLNPDPNTHLTLSLILTPFPTPALTLTPKNAGFNLDLFCT